MGSQASMSLDDLDSIMNLQRQEAFDDGGRQQTPVRRRLRATSSFDSPKRATLQQPKLVKSKSLYTGCSSTDDGDDDDGSGSNKRTNSKKKNSKLKASKSEAKLSEGLKESRKGKNKRAKSAERTKSPRRVRSGSISTRKGRSSLRSKSRSKSRSASGERKMQKSKKRSSSASAGHSRTSDHSVVKPDSAASKSKGGEEGRRSSKLEDSSKELISNFSKHHNDEQTPRKSEIDDAKEALPAPGDDAKPDDQVFESLWSEFTGEEEGSAGSKGKKKKSKRASDGASKEETKKKKDKKPSGSKSCSSITVTGTPDKTDSLVTGESTTTTTTTTEEKKKKSKIERIAELQEKYEKYKAESIDINKENRKLKRDLKFNKGQVASLTKEIDEHMSETTNLRKSLSEALQQVNQMSEEQQKERSEFLAASKELSQAKIDCTKALNDGRELRTQVDQLEETLARKERHAAQLTQTLSSRTDELDRLQIKLCRAEGEITRLEEDVANLENEIVMLKSVGGGGVGAGGNVSNGIDPKVFQERERLFEEKQRKLDDARREFEDEKRLHLQNEEKRRRQEEELKLKELEMEKGHFEGRQKMDEEINERLKQLEDNNSALQGRLKADQLESNVKLKKKEDEIASLNKDIERLKMEMAQKDADPEGITSLKLEIETKKNEVNFMKEDLVEAQKENGILEEQIEDLRSGNEDLREELKRLETEVADWKRQTDDWKKKGEEYKANASGWTAKTFEWKQKAEHWEKLAREMDPQITGQVVVPPAGAKPQAMLLQKAIDKKQVLQGSQAVVGVFGRLGGMFSKSEATEEDDAEIRVAELEEVNSQQAEIIKKLKSEMMKMRLEYRDEAYASKKKLQELENEKEALMQKNTTLTKELQLARKLESLTVKGDDNDDTFRSRSSGGDII